MTNPDQMLEQAAAAAERKEYWNAIALYTDILAQTDPHSQDTEVGQIRLTSLRERGVLFGALGEQEAALASYEQYYLEAGTSRHAVDALILIGNQQTYMAHLDKAMEAHREGLQLAEALNYTAGRANSLGGAGLVNYHLGRFEEAVSNFKKSLALLEQLGDRAEQARCWNRMGMSHARLGELDKAINDFKESSQLFLKISTRDLNALQTGINALNNLGECYQSLFDMNQALIYHQEGLKLVEAMNLPSLESDLGRNLGVDLYSLGRVEEGIAYLERSLKISRETNTPDIELQALYSLATAEIQRGNLEKGCTYAQELKVLAETHQTRGYQADSLHALGLYYRENEEVEEAQQLWQQALFLAHETGRRMLLWRIHAGLSSIAPNKALADVHNRIASEIILQILDPIQDETLCQTFLNAPPVRAIFNQLEEAA
ncbi:MAG: tetratricopeptide repeat protein [Candidatus Promineifilaceae bacterium]